ncbi:MAG: HAMP domain-containing protein [Clostridium argentinense]|uniref:histidine kinase n=1 Tax=Clostridium faecium TaxID=2762223 RepID=A0ABR8YUX0_9CLOT|nr:MULTISPECIES: HAMP domain-containing sensor histidine kinase [Clostridium]MBD8048035.1 HAMP domain-containing protein [Clostridium faecium]MBS5822270.1 HAMP domain-containing protein [Clostridium argentinense]MDU1348553.1 HAMP domain-containing sensor histidine kinase [Clostridium argentinense]
MKYRIKYKESISTKLFIVTTLIFTLFLSFSLLIQRIFFQSMYSNKKEQEIRTNTIKFSQRYDKLKNYEELTNLMKEYEENYNTYLAIVEYKYEFTITFNIEMAGENNKRGKYVSQILSELSTNEVLRNKLLKEKIIVFSVETTYSDNRDLVCIKLGDNKLIIGTTSLQPINEGISVIEEFYKYFYVVAIFIIIVLSFIYSIMITNPLKRINETAKKMSNLDFSEKCEVLSQDEIGNLAITLNFLSENLYRALSSLQRANIQLQKDIEKERKVEEVRKEFVAAVSHELKTPITIIKGYVEGIKDDIFSEEEKNESLDIILEETNKMGKLVKDMLDLSALESHATELKYEIFNLSEMIEKNIKSLNNEINDKDITIDRNYISDVYIKADKFRMEQVITNFLTNAIRHTEPLGFIWVAMNFEDNRLKVSVENSANPISDEEMHNIWNKFYKADKSRNRTFGGSGLGLSIVKNVLELHGMEYGTRNTDRGVEFYFYTEVEDFKDN